MTSFVGRRAELGEVRRLLESSRLVTITGAGGVGKTRVALRTAGDLGRRFPDGAWIVDLSGVPTPVVLAYTIASVLRMHDRTTRGTADVLAEQVAEKHLLLIMDTCEHLVDACAELAEKLLLAAPKLHIIATSRQRFGITGEHVLALQPLPVPGPEAETDLPTMRRSDAVILLADRAAAVVPGFTVSRRNGASVAALCRRLDGVPLAIEHAATRLRVLSVDQLVERLDDRARLLGAGRRGGVARHQTMHATISWSNDLCTRAERLAWARLSVFPCDFGLAAAERICAGLGITPHRELDVIAGLVDKSIVLVEQGGVEVRYRLLDDFRAYGRERMRTLGEASLLRERQRDWCLELARRGEQEWSSGRQHEAFERTQAEHANVRAALEFCLATPGEDEAGLELAATLWFYWIGCGRLAEGRYWLDRMIAQNAAAASARAPAAARPEASIATEAAARAASDPHQKGRDAAAATAGTAGAAGAAGTAALARALWARGYIAILQGDIESAKRLLEESRDRAAAVADELTVALSTHRLGSVALISDDHEKATGLLHDALNRYEKLGEPDSNAVMARVELAMAAVVRGDLDAATGICTQVQATCEASGEQWARAYARYVLAAGSLDGGDVEAAAFNARECLRTARALHDTVMIVLAAELKALVAANRGGGGGRAAVLLGAAGALWQDLGLPTFGSGYLLRLHDRCVQRTREALSEKEFAAASGYGAGLSLDEAVTLALVNDKDAAEPFTAPPAATSWPPLSNRECQVAGLVADGLCNREIAQRLVIAKRTADAHVEHILAKLTFNSRTQVAAWVTEQRSAHGGDERPGLGAA
jgi:predicted ATPase/DNA-binding NarL/FixJ family response regulator